jgi:hypothetical protein
MCQIFGLPRASGHMACRRNPLRLPTIVCVCVKGEVRGSRRSCQSTNLQVRSAGIIDLMLSNTTSQKLLGRVPDSLILGFSE